MTEGEGAKEAIPFPEEFRDGRWLSYDELGKIRGIGRPSAVKLAQREKWPRRLGNDRTARVLVPLEWLKLAKPLPECFREDVDIFPEVFRDTGAIWREAIQVASAAFERETAALRADHAQQFSHAEAMFQATIQALTGERDLLRGHVEALQAAAEQVQAEAREARDAAEAAQIGQSEAEADAAELRQAEAERRARGVLARLRAAWRGE